MGVAGSIVANLIAKPDKWNKGFASAQSVVNKLAAGVTAFAAIGVQRLTTVGDKLDKMSMRTGVAVRTLSQMKFAAEQSGGSVEELEKGYFGLSRSIFDAERGSKEAVEGFGRLGLSMDDLRGKSPHEQLLMVADGMQSVTDLSTRGAIAQKLFGRSGRQLLPLFASGSAGIRTLSNEADKLNITMTAAQATLGARMTDALNRSKRATEALSMKVGAVFIPILETAADFTARLASSGGDWVDVSVKIGLIIVGLAVGMKAYTLATVAWSRAQSVALALQGPKGWAQLAIGVGVATVAYAGITAALGDATAGLDSSGKSAVNATKALAKHTAAMQGNSAAGTTSAAVSASVAHSQNMAAQASARYERSVKKSGDMLHYMAGMSLRDIELKKAAGHTYDELVDKHLAARDSQEAYSNKLREARDLQIALTQNTQGLTQAIGTQATQSDKLSAALQLVADRRKLLAAIGENTGGAVDDKAFDDLDALRDQAIDKFSGYGDSIRGVRDEIDLMTGKATAASLALRDMAAKGVPSDKIGELKTAYDQLAKLKADNAVAEEQTQLADRKKLEAEQLVASRQSDADAIRKSLETPLDKIRREIGDINTLVNTPGGLSREEADRAIVSKVAELPPDFAARVASGVAGPLNNLTPPALSMDGFTAELANLKTPLERFSEASKSGNGRIKLLESMADRLSQQVASGKLTSAEANEKLSDRQQSLGVPDAPVVDSKSLEVAAQEQRRAIRDSVRNGTTSARDGKESLKQMAMAARASRAHAAATMQGVATAFDSPLERFKAISASIDERVAAGDLTTEQGDLDKQVAKAFAVSGENAKSLKDNKLSTVETQAVSTKSSAGVRKLAGILNRQGQKSDSDKLIAMQAAANTTAEESKVHLKTIATKLTPTKTKAFG